MILSHFQHILAPLLSINKQTQLAENACTIVPTPILLSHRAPGVPYPASIIELTECTVIMAIERTNGVETSSSGSIKGEKQQHPDTPTKEEWNRHCFQIVHTQHQDNETTPKTTTRIFTAPLVERNEWVFAMNNALLSYEKRLSKARSDAAKHDYWTATHAKKARHLGLESLHGPMLCRAVEEEKKERLHQWEQQKQQPWTNNGRSRMRSPSPVPRAKASRGLPPTSPRRVVSHPSRIRSVRSRSVTP